MLVRTTRDTFVRTKTRIKIIIEQLAKVHPDAKLDLDFSSALELLIALILAAQARDDLIRKITPGLFKKYRTAKDYAKTSIPRLQRDIGRINFYRKKSRSIHNCCSELVERFGGKVPDNLDDLLSLPGVGRKTANILLGNAFGQQTIGVDTHVMRLSQRLGLTEESDPHKIEADLIRVVSPAQRIRFCHLLQYHGRRICLAKKPKCAEVRNQTIMPVPSEKSLVSEIDWSVKPAAGNIDEYRYVTSQQKSPSILMKWGFLWK